MRDTVDLGTVGGLTQTAVVTRGPPSTIWDLVSYGNERSD
jgi:hypothetical protein